MKNKTATLEELETLLQTTMPHCQVVAGEGRKTLVRKVDKGVCDFCLDVLNAESFTFRAKPVEVKVGEQFSWISEDEWAACYGCGKYILTESWGMLLVRAATKYSKKFPEMSYKEIEEHIKFPQLIFRYIYIREE